MWLMYNTYLVFCAGAWAVPWWRCWAATLRGTSTKESRSSTLSTRATNPSTDFQTVSPTFPRSSSNAVSFAIHVTGRPPPNCLVIRLSVIGRHSGDAAQRFYRATLCVCAVFAVARFPSVCHAPCGLRGCKNRPTPFPGRMSYKATKPGLVLYLSVL